MSQYTDGSVAVTNGSATVTGTSTLFSANVAVGDSFKLEGENAVYGITAVGSNTSITISPVYAGTSGSGKAYVISKDFTPIHNMYEPNGGDVDWPFLLTQVLRRIDSYLPLYVASQTAGANQIPVVKSDSSIVLPGALSCGNLSATSIRTVSNNILIGGTIPVVNTKLEVFGVVGAYGLTFPSTQVASSDPNTLDDYREPTFTATATGMTTSPTGTVEFVKTGKMVIMQIPAIAGISNTTTFTLTGMPTTCRPSVPRTVILRITDNGVDSFGLAVIGTDGVITLYPTAAGGAFTSAGNKGVKTTNMSYLI